MEMYARADKPSNTAERIRLIMEERGLRQIDLIALTEPFWDDLGIRLSKSDLSQWLSGRSEPKQDKLLLLAHALKVSPAWLMGLDVPREWTPPEELAKEEARLLTAYRKLKKKDREYAMMFIERLAEDGEG